MLLLSLLLFLNAIWCAIRNKQKISNEIYVDATLVMLWIFLLFINHYFNFMNERNE